MSGKADIGLIGLAVMGQNLVLNMNDHGFTVAVYNRTISKVDEFINGAAKGTKVIGAHSIEEFTSTLKKPRRAMLMVKAGQAVDDFIELLLPHLEAGDIIIDGGSPKAWEAVKPIFQSIAAKANGEPCCDWVGENGAGHYVKMVHNGIEYGDMQLICEAYDLMKRGLGMSNEEMHHVFARFNKGKLDSYLIEITRDILGYRDENGAAVIDLVLDAAGQKGTGKWTVISSMDLGIPITLVSEAVYARSLSAMKDERLQAAKILQGPATKFDGDKEKFVNDLEEAMYAAKIISYAQGYMLLRAAAKEHKWNLNYGGIALMWRGGCIIRSVFLGDIRNAFQRNPNLTNLLMDSYFSEQVTAAQAAWRRVVMKATELGIPIPAMASALNFFDGYRQERLPANLLQAQRDYFGAHTYERIDKARGQFFHTNWTGRGGEVTAGKYNN
jgi:6-phosphogluconate dehydrogenase